MPTRIFQTLVDAFITASEFALESIKDLQDIIEICKMQSRHDIERLNFVTQPIDQESSPASNYLTGGLYPSRQATDCEYYIKLHTASPDLYCSLHPGKTCCCCPDYQPHKLAVFMTQEPMLISVEQYYCLVYAKKYDPYPAALGLRAWMTESPETFSPRKKFIMGDRDELKLAEMIADDKILQYKFCYLARKYYIFCAQ